MSEYAKNIQTVEDLWKKRIELRSEVGGGMREYIITDKQLKTATEAYLEHELSRPITDVFISGDKLPEIVRCGDCKHYRFVDRSDIFHDERHNDSFCLRFVDGKRMEVEADGFCAWGERRES